MAKERVVVVGCGLSGASVVAALTERAPLGSLKIDVLSTEAHGVYDRFDLPRVLEGTVTAEQVVRHDRSWFEARGVSLHAGKQARYVDRFRRLVQAEDLAVPYDKLVIATGSGPYLPPIRGLLRADGRLHHGAFAFRSLADCDALDAALSTMRRVAVLGGGPLGLSLVSALRRRGAAVQLFHVGSRLMSGQLDDAAGRFIEQRVRDLGAEVHFGRRATALLGDGQLRGLAFHDGAEVECDALVLATGFQPDTWLGFQCGLTVERGIAVDGHLRSIDDPNVYALGECAQWRASIHGAPEQIEEQAAVIAEQLLDRRSERRYLGRRSASRFEVAGLALAAMGNPLSKEDDDVAQLFEPSRARYKKVVLRSGRLVSAILLGDLRQAASLSRLYDASTPLAAESLAELFDLSVPQPAR